MGSLKEAVAEKLGVTAIDLITPLAGEEGA